ncbi:MAG: hypothetical protein OEM02_05220 [Desulfobulbaceae bacterium]|nr:hypothetical protein [Desulfobulbaceae bacterium]
MSVKVFRYIFIVVTLAMLGGCGGYGMNNQPTSQGYLPPITGYADDALQDIEIPTELKWEYENSMAIKTESFHGGIWHYSGDVELVSLKNFIVTAMKNNKWKQVGEVASTQTLLAFVKPNKNCMVVISDSYFGKTELTLYVTIDKAAAGAMNPFGEAVNR